jgi:hypothetical protein
MRALTVILTLSAFFLSVFTPVPVQAAPIDLTFKGDVLSANLEETRLKEILEKLEREKGISWTGNSSLVEEKITLQFKDLSLNEGVKRILGSMNHCLIFDANERLAYVIIIGERTRGKVKTGRKIVAQNKRTQQTHTAKTNKTREVSNGPPAVTKKDHGGFRVIRNVPSPGSVSEPTVEEMEKFKVQRNLPPPGGSTQVSEEVLESFKVRRNLPPPGGSTQVSKETLESFKVRRNLPPPGSTN